MMHTISNAFRILVIAGVVLDHRCMAHECFQCRSDKHVNCADLIDPETYRKPCTDSSHGFCRKSTFTLYFADQSQPVVLRECVNRQSDESDMEEGCYSGKYRRDSTSLTCECRGECCNGSHLSNYPSVFSLYHYVMIELIIRLVLR